MSKVYLYISFILGLFVVCNPLSGQSDSGHKHIIANPLDLNYRFQLDEPSRREAADPVIEYFKGKYYLFASKSGGYWSSSDLSEWTYIPCKSITTIEGYAPAILVYKDTMYYLASGEPRIFKTANPDEDSWTDAGGKFGRGVTDPAFFKDDDGKVYLYWGCSDKDPIMGVEVDPDNGFKEKGEAVALIEHNIDKYGWEVPGENNEEVQHNGWNEGPCMIKYEGKYYLQYAAPGTQFRTYGDGVYMSDKPLGPYVYVNSNPFCFKPGGFIGGAGHGYTFRDKYGNFWHIATMKISVRHMFERRLGLFPVYMIDNELHSHTVLTDYPFYIPGEKTDFEKTDCSMNWNMLSYNKAVSASSSLRGYEPANADDEKVETWWAAGSGKPGEWLQIDLGKEMQVNAIQVNFADHNFTLKAPDTYVYQYDIVASENGEDWKKIVDRTSNTKDRVHELIVFDMPLKTRYIRIRNAKEVPGNFSLYDFRIFGNGLGKQPQTTPEMRIVRNAGDKRIIDINWDKVNDATGYIVRWGVAGDKLENATMIYSDNTFEGRFFNRDSDYYFSIDSFNENGITKGSRIYSTGGI